MDIRLALFSFVIVKMWLQCKRASKIHVLLLLQIFMFQLSSAFNPASTTNANQDPFEGSEVHCAYRYIFFKYTVLKPGSK
jgi:hypothetical protein